MEKAMSVKNYIRIILMFFLCVVNPAFAIDGNELLKQVDMNLNPESFEMYRKLINIEPDGSKKEFVMYSVKKGKEKIASIFLSPSSEKGRATLRIRENMWLYIPNIKKPVRITSMQSVTGGVFNNSDIMQLDYHVEYNCEKAQLVKDEYILHLKAKTNKIAYDKVKMWVIKEKRIPAKVECYTSSGMLIKTLYFKKIKDFGNGIVRPAVIETDSPLQKGYRSKIIFAKVQKKELADEVFTLNFMPMIDSLR